MDANVSVDVGKNLTQLLEKLASAIGTTVDKIYPYYVKQVAYEAWTWLIISGIIFLVSIYLLSSCTVSILSFSEVFQSLVFLIVTVSVISFVFFIVGLVVNIPVLLNPEYAAIQRIITQLQTLK